MLFCMETSSWEIMCAIVQGISDTLVTLKTLFMFDHHLTIYVFVFFCFFKFIHIIHMHEHIHTVHIFN